MLTRLMINATIHDKKGTTVLVLHSFNHKEKFKNRININIPTPFGTGMCISKGFIE